MIVPIELYSAWWTPEFGVLYRFDQLVAERLPWDYSVGYLGYCLN